MKTADMEFLTWKYLKGLVELVLGCFGILLAQSVITLKLPEIHLLERSYQAEEITGRYGLNSAWKSALFQDRYGYV